MSTDNPFDPGEGPGGQSHDLDVTPVPLDVGPILSRSAGLAMAQPGIVIGGMLLVALPSLLLGGADMVLEVGMELIRDEGTQAMLGLASVGVNLLDLVVYLFLQLGLIRLFLGVAYGQPVELGMLVGEAQHFPGAVVQGILMTIGIVFATLLFIIPGIILAIDWQFGLILMVDRRLDPISALKASWALTEGYRLSIFVVNLVTTILLLMLSCMTFGLGFLVAGPAIVLTQVVMYQSLVDLQAYRLDPELSEL